MNRSYDGSPITRSFDKVVDIGAARTTFATGAERERPAGKGRFDLIPAYSYLRLAQHFENGAKKYADRNWEKGLPLSTFLNSAEHHITLFKLGDRSEDHWGAVAWNAFAYMHTEEMIRLGHLPKELADVPQGGPWSLVLKNNATVANELHPQPGTVRSARGVRAARRKHSTAKARARQLPRRT